jgi:hypothetical protein
METLLPLLIEDPDMSGPRGGKTKRHPPISNSLDPDLSGDGARGVV